MNLVQINERLKDLPTQVIQQYANGMNPEIPPYLALGELQRRETAQRQMATAQGAAQGPMPSIKEQVEQKAGLLAAQGLQQQQMMQMMAQPRGPLPAPAGVPQPEAQPEAMARGGLTRAPVRFDFQRGGIVAFNGEDGSEVKPKYETPYDRMNRKNREEEERRRRALEAFNEQLRADPAQVKMREEDQAFEALSPAERSAERGQRLRDFFRNVVAAPPAAVVQAPMAAPATPAAVNRGMLNRADAALRSAPGTPAAPPAPAAPVADLKALADQQRRQQGPRPTAAPATPAAPAAPAAPAPNSMEAMFRAQLENAPKERTVPEIQAEQRAIREGAGLTEPAGLAQLERIRKLQEQYESGKPSGLDNLIRVFGQAGQYKGLSGLAPAYTANQQQQRAADLAMAQKINEMMSGIETTQRGEMKDIATGTSTARAADRAAGVDFGKSRLSALGTARGQDITAQTAEEQRKTTERGQDLNYKAAMAQVNAIAARNKLDLTANQRALIADKALDNVNNMLKANMKLQIDVGKNPALMQQLLKAETDRLMAAAGGTTMPAAPGAASPGGTSLKYNPATGKIE